ncbi:MAG: AMP-binding protein [Acidobacteriota bacterium]|nr:AMP-binding protein [Acidobacteriota bacterium]
MRNSIHTFLDDCLGRGEETAFAEQHGLRVVRRTYAELANTAYRFARELEARDINKGDRVLIWAENSAEWVAVFFGCALRGVVVVPLDEQSAPDFAVRVQQQVNAKLLLCGSSQQKLFADRLPTLRLGELEAAIAQHSSEPFTPNNIAEDDLLEIIFTSGTTAEPKGVCLTHRNLLANLNPLETEIQKYLWLERPFHPLRFLCLLPLSHVFGQFMGVFVPLLLGGEVFFSHSQKPADIIATIKRERISVAAAVPRQLETLREKIERDFAASGKLDDFRRRFDEADGKHFALRWWRFRDVHRLFGWKFLAFVSGGATLDEQTENFWQRLSFAVVQGYGMTETASLVSLNHPFKASRGSIGKTLPGQQVRLGEGGEILVRGENVAAGYWRDGVQKMPEGEGWLKTGDVAALDESGNLFFKGRQKDVIVTSAGLNIYPDDLELALTHQPEVRAACVIGVEGAQGPEPMAVLILRDDKTDAASIIKQANAGLNSSQQIRRWFVWPEADFPRTTTQKIRKPLVKEFVGRISTGSGSDRVDSAAHTRADSLAALAAKFGAEDLSKLDSLGRVALLSAIEDRYQIELDEAALTPDTKLSDLEKMISAGNHTRADKSESAIEYPYPRWALRWPITWLRVAAYYLLIVPFVYLMCWPRVHGRERLPKQSAPMLFIANHISMVDPGMILFALPWRFKHRLAIAMAGERLRGLRQRREGSNRLSRMLDPIKYLLVVTVFNVFPLPQKSGFRRSFAYAGEAVDLGFSVLIFPEGRTTDDGQMKPFMSGIGLLTGNLNLPVVPIKIEGLFDLTKQRRYFSSPGTVTVTFGESVLFSPDTEAAHITSHLEKLVREL